MKKIRNETFPIDFLSVTIYYNIERKIKEI